MENSGYSSVWQWVGEAAVIDTVMLPSLLLCKDVHNCGCLDVLQYVFLALCWSLGNKVILSRKAVSSLWSKSIIKKITILTCMHVVCINGSIIVGVPYVCIGQVTAGGVLIKRPAEVFGVRCVCDTCQRESDVSLSDQKCKPRVSTALLGDDSIRFVQWALAPLHRNPVSWDGSLDDFDTDLCPDIPSLVHFFFHRSPPHCFLVC